MKCKTSYGFLLKYVPRLKYPNIWKRKGIQLESERLNFFHNSLSASYYYATNIRTFFFSANLFLTVQPFCVNEISSVFCEVRVFIKSFEFLIFLTFWKVYESIGILIFNPSFIGEEFSIDEIGTASEVFQSFFAVDQLTIVLKAFHLEQVLRIRPFYYSEFSFHKLKI